MATPDQDQARGAKLALPINAAPAVWTKATGVIGHVVRHHAGVNLNLLNDAVARRRERWDAASLTWEIVRDEKEPPTPKPAVSLRVEGQVGIAELILWSSGEADLTHARLSPKVMDPTTEHYEITSAVGLEGCLDDLERHIGLNK